MFNEFEVPKQDMGPPSPSHEPQWRKKKHEHFWQNRRLWLIAGIVLAVLLVAGAAAWFFMSKKDEAPKQSSEQKQSAPSDTPAPVPADDTPVTFKSTKLNIELTHRKDWSLKENATGEITLTSPPAPYSTADGEATTGMFTFKIRKGATEEQQATIDKSIASRDSVVIAYAAPTEQQRFYTNISYAGANKDVFSFFIVTGSTEFKSGMPFQYALPIPDDGFLITGGYGADKSNTLAYESVPKSTIDSAVVEQAIDIVESLKIF